MNNITGVVEGTQILTPSGFVPVEGIVPGDYVLSASWEGDIVAATVKNVIANDYTGPVRTFCTDSNKCLSITPGHVLFVDIAKGAPANVWAQIGREVLTDKDVRKRLDAWNNLDWTFCTLHSEHSFERQFSTQRKTGTIWLEVSDWSYEEEVRTPEGYVTNPAIVFESYEEIAKEQREPIVKFFSFVRDFDAAWKITWEAQQQHGLEDVRLDFRLGDWRLLNDPVTIYTSLAANLLTPWHFAPTADEYSTNDSLLHIRSARVCDILDDDYDGRVYDLCVNPLCNYLAAGIVVFGAREHE